MVKKNTSPINSLEALFHELVVQVGANGLVDVTALLTDWLATLRARDGLLIAFLKQASAHLAIEDILGSEGPQPAPKKNQGSASLKSGTTAPLSPAHKTGERRSLSIPVINGRLTLSELQRVYLSDPRAQTETRTIELRFFGSQLRTSP